MGPPGGIRRLLWLCVVFALLSGGLVAVGALADLNAEIRSLSKLVFLVAAFCAVGILILRRWLGDTRTTSVAKNLALLGVTVGVALVVSEFAVRALTAGMTTTGDNSSYWARRWLQHHVRVNRLGFREREVAARKESGIYRIAVIGDSYTYGQGIEEAARFTNQIEQELNLPRRHFEVLNFGRPGAETIDEVGILGDPVLGLEPDFVLLQWFVNDGEGHDKTGRPKNRPLLPSATLREWLHRHSTLYYILEQQWSKVQASLGWTTSYEAYMRRRFGDAASPDSRAAEAQLAEFVAMSLKRGIPMGIVLFPTLRGRGVPEYPFDFLHDRVLAWCQREQVDCLDLREVFRNAEQRADLRVNRFDGHPNSEANRIAAGAIRQHFEPRWLTPQRSD